MNLNDYILKTDIVSVEGNKMRIEITFEEKKYMQNGKVISLLYAEMYRETTNGPRKWRLISENLETKEKSKVIKFLKSENEVTINMLRLLNEFDYLRVEESTVKAYKLRNTVHRVHDSNGSKTYYWNPNFLYRP